MLFCSPSDGSIIKLTTPIPGVESGTLVLNDAGISLGNLASERGYGRLYGMKDLKREQRLLLFLYRRAAATWINEAGADNFITEQQYMRLIGEIENINQTCECYPLT